MTLTPDFILQLAATVGPLLGTMYAVAKRQNAKIAVLQTRILDLEHENAELKERFDKLSIAHTDLQARYEETLQIQAGMRKKW